MRLYQAALLGDFAARGGHVVFGAVRAGDLDRLAAGYALLVVATGRGRLAERFPVLPERSPYTQPQRRLCAGLYRGIAHPEPLSVAFTISPGHGELFEAAFRAAEGRVSSLLIEAIPGGGLEPVCDLRYEDDPRRFNATVLALLREHAPAVYERVEPQRFGLTGPLDLHKGAITPVVRRGYLPLVGGRYAVAIFEAAADDQAIADEVCDNFGAPERNWAIFGSPQGAAAFLARFRQPVTA
jgi:Styrene monooxygenase A putative substrate binding domain